MNHRTVILRVFTILAILLAGAGCTAPAPTAQGQPAALAAATQNTPAATQPAVKGAEQSPLYQDAKASVPDRVEDLLARMTIAEKLGQMTQVEKNSIAPDDITRLHIGSILSGGGGSPDQNTPAAWAKMVDGFQQYALQTRLGIPLIYGVDAVHGHNNLRGAVIFPHNVGLGAANDPKLMEQIGRATAEEMAATGIRWNFAPVVAVPQDIRWGRTYEGYSEDTAIVTALGAAYIRGLQNAGSLATPKHFIGDGGAKWGTSTTDNYKLDQGDMQVDEATLRALFLPPYKAAIDAGAQSIMVSFSSWNGTKMHAQKHLLTGLLKGELGFKGFLVSDWQAIDQIPGGYYNAVVTSINAGLDMIMVPVDYKTFLTTLQQAVKKGDISLARIDDAVRRILAAKFSLGLFEQPYSDPALLPLVGSEVHRALARQAVAKSLVLLKNDNQVLPLSNETPLIFVGGSAADDIGTQCGGWTMEWQGKTGNITPGTTILGALQAAGEKSRVVYDSQGSFKNETGQDGKPSIADVGVAVVGEPPYAEGVGDRSDLSLSAADQALIQGMRERSRKLVVILISGRPMLITNQLPRADAWVAAWLPGTEGQGVADVLFDDVPFTGKLAYTWPRSMDQLPQVGVKDPLFPVGYGLSY